MSESIAVTVLNGIFPKEVLYHIFSLGNLSGEDLKACSLVCKLWKETSDCNTLWYKCCVREISSKMEENRFEVINLEKICLSVDYKNLYNKYTIKKFPFHFFRSTEEDLKERKNELTSIKERISSGIRYVICCPYFILVCDPCWSLFDLANKIRHTWAKEICNCQSCNDTRSRLFSWDAEKRE
jgi:hypothetical protein